MRLFEIADQIERILLDGTDRETGEISEEALAALEALEGDREKKALDVAAYIVGERCEAEAVRLQAERLHARAIIHQKRAERLELYLGDNTERGVNLDDARVTIKWRKSQAVVVDDETVLPDAFWRQPPVPLAKPDKAKLKAALKSGEAVPGARIEHRLKLSVK